MKERLATLAFDAVESTPETLSDHMKAETAKWTKVLLVCTHPVKATV